MSDDGNGLISAAASHWGRMCFSSALAVVFFFIVASLLTGVYLIVCIFPDTIFIFQLAVSVGFCVFFFTSLFNVCASDRERASIADSLRAFRP